MFKVLVAMAEPGVRWTVRALRKIRMLLSVRGEHLSPYAFMKRPSLCSKNVMHLKTLFRHSGAPHHIKCCWGGTSLQGRGYPESEINLKFHHFLDFASVNEMTWCYIKYSFKNPPVHSQRAERRDTEKTADASYIIQLYFCEIHLLR